MKVRAQVIVPRFFSRAILEQTVPKIRAKLRGPISYIAKKAFNKRTRNWKKHVGVKSRYTRPAGTFGQLRVVPAGSNDAVRLWAWVSLGTRSYVITPKNAPELVFRIGYIRKTLPGNVYGRPGGIAIGPTIRTQRVKHPGIEARDFEKHIRDEVVGKIEKILEATIVEHYNKKWPLVKFFGRPISVNLK